MAETEPATMGVDAMPLEELRARTRDVHVLLRATSDDVRAVLTDPSAGSADVCVARLLDALARVQSLLPGLSLLSPESKRRLELPGGGPEEHGTSATQPPPPPQVPPIPHRLTELEIARAREILAELKDGIERVDLLGSVAGAVEDLVAAIEGRRQALRENPFQDPPDE